MEYRALATKELPRCSKDYLLDDGWHARVQEPRERTFTAPDADIVAERERV